LLILTRENDLGDNNNEWQAQAIILEDTGLVSRRKIAKIVGVARSTCGDFLRSYDRFKGSVDVEVFPTRSKTHLYIPDNQVKDGVDLSYLSWIGKYIVRKRPDVIVSAGDFSDMESLSSYDVGKRSAEGKRVQKDIEVSHHGMAMLLKPLRDLQAQQRQDGVDVYEPRLVLTMGNHENRIDRHVEANPSLHNFLSVDALKYEEAGWEVVPFLTPIMIDGIAYCHYFTNNMTGKPLGGSALNMLKTIGTSFTQGHRQTLDVATRFLPANGKQHWGIVAGACYLHNEDYKGVTGNHHWRGIIVKNNVDDGSYDPLFVSLNWLRREYGETKF
jgi:hypothetical protein